MTRIAFLTSQYPAISHTFILREVEALRARGLDIQTFSVRPATASGVLTDADRRELAQTFVLLVKPYERLLKDNLRGMIKSPRRYWRTARTAYMLRTVGLEGLLKWAAYFAEGVHLGEELKRRRIDHLHNHFANAAANVAMLASEYSGVPFSFTLHGVHELFFAGVGPIADKVARAKFLTCICDFNKSQAMRMVPVALWNRIFVSRCGIALEDFPRKPPGPRAPGPIRILSVARFSKEKAIPGLVEAFGRAVQAGLDGHLILVGDGDERPRVEAEIARWGVQDRVELRGRQAGEAVRKAFVEADVFALASLMEGLPIVIMEAMATGTPVVAPNLAGIPELVVDGVSGLLFAPARWDELADRLLELARDAKLRQRLADAGRAEVELQHDIHRAVLPMEDLLLGRTPPTPQPHARPERAPATGQRAA